MHLVWESPIFLIGAAKLDSVCRPDVHRIDHFFCSIVTAFWGPLCMTDISQNVKTDGKARY